MAKTVSWSMAAMPAKSRMRYARCWVMKAAARRWAKGRFGWRRSLAGRRAPGISWTLAKAGKLRTPLQRARTGQLLEPGGIELSLVIARQPVKRDRAGGGALAIEN